jgi:putative phage-type endonuclease
MSLNTYGQLGEIIKFINKHIKKNTKDIFKLILKKYPMVQFELVNDIIHRINKDGLIKMNMNFRNYDNIYNINEVENNKIKVQKEYKKYEDQFQKLYAKPQPEQRTQEWFDYRYNRITASDMATAIDLNPYESIESFICKKCNPNFPFLDNEYVFHGKKYEQIATQLYEHIYNIKVTEFGCVPSDKYLFLGASPDGICSKATLDNNFSPMIGTMLEIKCPKTRKIISKGKIAGEICPFYYYCQVQQQLECCELDYCDFWQCEIKEYKNRTEYILDEDFKPIFAEGTEGEIKEINSRCTRGCLLQFLPKVYEPSHEQDKHEYKSHYIYPPRLDMIQEEYDRWCLETISNWYIYNPELAENYYFDKIIYWKIPKSHNVKITRDIEWFNSIYPILVDTWKKVNYYRDNEDKLPKLQQIADSRRKFYRMNTNFKINNFKYGELFIEPLEKDKNQIDYGFTSSEEE